MGAYQVWVRVKRDQQKEKGDHHVYEWVHIKCGRENKETSKKKKETTRCMNGCISSVGEGKKRPVKRKRRPPCV
jgi:hypothetical protein